MHDWAPPLTLILSFLHFIRVAHESAIQIINILLHSASFVCAFSFRLFTSQQ
jgi:hypothetical protein